MAEIHWTVPSDGIDHVVVLRHDYVSGQATITVDGEIVFHRKRKWIDWGLKQRVVAGRTECVVSVNPIWAVFRYSLFTNGKIQPAVSVRTTTHPFMPWRWFDGVWCGMIPVALICYVFLLPPARYATGRLFRHFGIRISRPVNIVFLPAECLAAEFKSVRWVHESEWKVIGMIHRSIYDPPPSFQQTPPPVIPSTEPL